MSGKTIAIVPIRSGSKRIKDKNITEFLGKPLFWWVCNALENSSVDQFIVSSDSQEYLDRVIDCGFTKMIPHVRSEEDSTDTATTEQVMVSALQDNNIKKGVVLLSQVTSPWVTSRDINYMINSFNTGQYTSILSVAENNKFLWKKQLDKYVIEANYDSMNRPRSQDFEDTYFIENGGLYINDIYPFLRNKNRILESLVGYYKMPWWTSIEIDTIEDLQILEYIMKQKGFLE